MIETATTSNAQRTVLIVEDERLLRWALAKQLQRAGYQVLEAASVAEAGPLASGADLILLDLKLPDGDGLEALRTWRGAGARCPVVVMSAFTTVEAERQGPELGVRHYASKPFDTALLLGLVRQILH